MLRRQPQQRRLPAAAAASFAAAAAIMMAWASRRGAVAPPPAATAAGGGGGASASSRNATVGPALIEAVNLRDLADASPLVRRGALYRCSCVYSDDVLRRLRIATVRERRERGGRRRFFVFCFCISPL